MKNDWDFLKELVNARNNVSRLLSISEHKAEDYGLATLSQIRESYNDLIKQLTDKLTG